jgi:putative RNA 2'-phosphotransferase
MKDRRVRISKFLSLVLRHRPDQIGLTLGDGGWVNVSELLRALEAAGFPLALEELQAVVRANDKQRFSFSPDGLLIRANQGHSVKVELGYEATEPPSVLYHGTAERFLPSIRRQGLVKGSRHHVHLSDKPETARAVGSRYGVPVVLEIASGRMRRDGRTFFRSANGVWLAESVPAEYINFRDDAPDPTP